MTLHKSLLTSVDCRVKAASINVLGGISYGAYRLLDPLYFYHKERLSILDNLIVPSEVINHYEHACVGEEQVQKRSAKFLDGTNFRRITEESCVIATPCSNNYFHWFEDVLKVAHLELCGFNGVYVITEDLPSFCSETLQLLRIPKDRILVASEDLALENTFVCHQSNLFNCDHRPHLLHWLRSKLSEPPLGKQGDIERVYLQRFGSRKVVNETEVIEAISSYGFSVLQSESLTLKDQIGLFMGTQVLLGPHGAGFANCLFMPSGSRVIEAFSPFHIYPCMHKVHKVLCQDYRMLCGLNAPWESYPYQDSVYICLDQLETALIGLNCGQSVAG